MAQKWKEGNIRRASRIHIRMKAHWSKRSAIPAKLLLAHLRPDLSALQQQSLLNNYAAYLGLSRCTFGRRGPQPTCNKHKRPVTRP